MTIKTRLAGRRARDQHGGMHPVPRNRSFFSLALLAIAVASLAGFPSRAQQKKGEERFTSYSIPRAAGLRIKEVVRTRLFHDMQAYFEKGASGAYERREAITTMEEQVRIGDRTQSQFLHEGNPVRIPPAEHSVKLIPHQGTIFAKIVSKFEPYGPGTGITLEENGMYEMKVVEGSYEDFQKGGSVSVEIKENDRERYLAALTKAFQHPGFLTFNAEEFRSVQLKEMENVLAQSPEKVLPPGAGQAERDRLLEQVRTWRVRAIPSVTETPTRYRFTGDTMTSETKLIALEIRYETSVPAANETVDPNADWMERYKARKQSDFHAEDFDPNRVLDPREKLPGWYKPKWEQQKPAQ